MRCVCVCVCDDDDSDGGGGHFPSRIPPRTSGIIEYGPSFTREMIYFCFQLLFVSTLENDRGIESATEQRDEFDRVEEQLLHRSLDVFGLWLW